VTCALLLIGTELTRGELRDKNGGDLAERLTDLGYEVAEICLVDDDDARIVSAIRRLAKSHEFVTSTGGLGPTTDDRTSACAGVAAGKPLVRNAEAHQHLLSLMKARGRPLSPASEKQADFPEGAEVLKNPRGTAPGFSMELDGCRLFFMPGVPSEMEYMFEKEVLPRLPPPKERIVCRRLRTFGLPEVDVNDRLAGVEESHRVVIGYRASHSEIEVKVLARDFSEGHVSDLERRAEGAAAEIRRRLADFVYAEGTVSLPEALGELLRQKNLTLGLAESCTGGLVSQMMTSVPGASAYYLGGVCSYDNSVKISLLGVDPDALAGQGAVSEVVARQMADGARRALGVDIALAITGIAGPDGGSDEKPVGLVHFAVATANETRACHQTFRGTRAQIQRRAALFGLWQVRAALL
jgi:nicotinamide-nucleotide amidase